MSARGSRHRWLVRAVVALAFLSADAPDPGGPEASLERAESLLMRGEAQSAAEIFAQLAEQDPGDARSRAGRVRSLLALDRWREALTEAQRFSAQLPSSPEVSTVLGEASLRAGRFEAADAALSPVAAAMNDPDHGGIGNATMARALLALGRLRDAEGRTPVAADYLNRALELAPDDRAVLYGSSGAAPDRATLVSRLERYLELSDGDDADRIEAARGKIRFYAQLGDRRVWGIESRPERAQVPLIPIDNGLGSVLGYAVDVSIGPGKPVRLMLDSGSTGLFLLERIARKHGFEPLAVETVFGGGGDQRHASPRGLFPELEIGGLRFSNALATTTEHEIEPTGRFHGLIGLSVFAGYRIVLDLAEFRVLLDRTGPESSEGSSYWDVSGQMLVWASTSAGAGGLFLLDTGATHTAISLDLAEHAPEVKLGGPVEVQGFGGSLAGSRIAHGIRVELDGIATAGNGVNATDLSVRSRLGGVEISGMVGLDLLDGKRVDLDTRSQRLSVSQAEARGRKGKREKKNR